jgi:uncharacterized protein (TIGR01777 family)
MRVLIAGGSGYIGTELVRELEAHGHTVEVLTRSENPTGKQHSWNPVRGEIDQAVIDNTDAVINLAGASISRIPWSMTYEREILDSRIRATTTLVSAITSSASPPAVLLNASAVGFYGDRPGETLTEQSKRGTGFLARVTGRWERAAERAAQTTRVVTFRTGLVVGQGGAFGPLGLLTRLGLGARVGNGDQYWPWIALSDEAGAIRHLLDSELSGPVNLEGPTPATSEEVTRSLAAAMKRWHPFVLPAPLITTVLGTAGKELLLSSQRAVPERLEKDGFEFRYATIDEAIASVWG